VLDDLREAGEHVSRKRVARLMKERGLITGPKHVQTLCASRRKFYGFRYCRERFDSRRPDRFGRVERRRISRSGASGGRRLPRDGAAVKIVTRLRLSVMSDSRSGRSTIVIFSVGISVVLGCASSPLTSPSANADAGSDVDDGGLDSGASPTPHADAAILRAVASPSDPTDPRLVAFLSGQSGASINGWDLCYTPTPLSRGPGNCSDCPPATRGPSYLRYTGGPLPSCGARPDQQCPREPDSQINGYFAPELAGGSRQAVWFDLAHIAGDPTDASLTIYATLACGTLETLGTWSMSDILSKATGWLSTCVTITPNQPTSELGFRFAGADVDLGFQGPWFGADCPTP
jgi:hypothetical protein